MEQTTGPAEVADESAVEESIARTYRVPAKLDAELEKRFTYHAPQADQLPRYEEIRRLGLYLARRIAALTPPSREQSLALTNLEEAVMHANSAIAREPREPARGAGTLGSTGLRDVPPKPGQSVGDFENIGTSAPSEPSVSASAGDPVAAVI